ncbi:small subunit ribosomal protein S9 [Marchantia polymorpha subsp. ruderalis]|uniref:Small ribosomal subunit protein uS9c n=2 Tax=Marchantia polymorpha TaxID=3197 RepID=A0A176VLC2_MARPO|nr:hypothetical protein AXG93_4012s1340 [Marchantia polymorpha subsp. ruderalis]PTQ47770.1 hypothetical protein MARPO_0007s0166 [Marchantia polymorpha]BBN04083.1 hypothetical protein Mp_3g01740 [Marchantia polymorpha subsp. ruderalis]|eukprot:PTQ47770.1 hypothetical protein MARPO_0007s0166 [Marchantia polymorpha]
MATMAALTSSLGSLQLGIASSCSCSDKATAASLGSRFSVQNGVSLRPALRIASLKASSSSSASAAVKVCAVGAAVSEDNEVDLEAYVKSVLPGGFAAARLWGTGRRKTAVARVVLVDGTGQIIINNRTAQDYLQGNPLWLQAVKYPLASLGYEQKYDTIVRAEGGGLSAQAQAILLGIARALIVANQANREPLKKQGLLTRDSRVVERKKYGLKKARKAPQFSKR